MDRSPRTLRVVLTAVFCGIFPAARAEEAALGTDAAQPRSAIGGFIDTGFGVEAVPEPSTQVLVGFGAVIAGIFARRSRRR